MYACQSAVPGQVTGGPSEAARSSQPPTQVRMDVLNQERIMSYITEGVGVGILSHGRNVVIFKTPCFQGIAVQICLQGNERVVY